MPEHGHRLTRAQQRAVIDAELNLWLTSEAGSSRLEEHQAHGLIRHVMR
jgi:hypothetical protein